MRRHFGACWDEHSSRYELNGREDGFSTLNTSRFNACNTRQGFQSVVGFTRAVYSWATFDLTSNIQFNRRWCDPVQARLCNLCDHNARFGRANKGRRFACSWNMPTSRLLRTMYIYLSRVDRRWKPIKIVEYRDIGTNGSFPEFIQIYGQAVRA